MKKETILEAIVALILGHKYYANISYRRGVADDQFINSKIFRTKEEADAHRMDLDTNASFAYVETVSFRSRNEY